MLRSALTYHTKMATESAMYNYIINKSQESIKTIMTFLWHWKNAHILQIQVTFIWIKYKLWTIYTKKEEIWGQKCQSCHQRVACRDGVVHMGTAFNTINIINSSN